MLSFKDNFGFGPCRFRRGNFVYAGSQALPGNPLRGGSASRAPIVRHACKTRGRASNPGAFPGRAWERVMRRGFDLVLAISFVCCLATMSLAAEDESFFFTAPGFEHEGKPQIGRASCRERV